jgi:hypothetical protein
MKPVDCDTCHLSIGIRGEDRHETNGAPGLELLEVGDDGSQVRPGSGISHWGPVEFSGRKSTGFQWRPLAS